MGIVGRAVGDSGTIIRTTDYATTWVKEFSGVTNQLNSISFIDYKFYKHWILAGNNGIILKTTDEGNNWILKMSNTTKNLNALFSIVPEFCWIVGDGGTILKTTDAGENWFHQSSGTSNNLKGVHFRNIYFGWAVGDAGTILKTTNGGDNWVVEYSGITKNLTSIYFANWDLGWTVGDDETILTSLNLLPVELISFRGENTNGKIILTWNTSTELNNIGFEVQRKTENHDWKTIGFVQGKGTTTEIQNYTYEDFEVLSTVAKRIWYKLKQLDFNGSYKYSDEIEVNVVPNKFELSQNYPNPFNPSTKLRYSIPLNVKGETEKILLKVYDILGNEIETLVNEAKSPGTYEITWNAVGLPSGVYFYRLHAGDFVETRKMILLR